MEFEVALIGGCAAMGGGIVTGVATYFAAHIGFRSKQLRARLRSALEDNEFLREVEAMAVAGMADLSGRTATSIRSEWRDQIRARLGRELHRSSELARTRTALDRLRD